MLRSDAIVIGNAELERHGLTQLGWKTVIDPRSLKRLGECIFEARQIRVTGWHVDTSPDDDILDTIRHEIAHAMAGAEADHGPDWVAACAITGADPCVIESRRPHGRVAVSLYQTIRRTRKGGRS